MKKRMIVMLLHIHLIASTDLPQWRCLLQCLFKQRWHSACYAHLLCYICSSSAMTLKSGPIGIQLTTACCRVALELHAIATGTKQAIDVHRNYASSQGYSAQSYPLVDHINKLSNAHAEALFVVFMEEQRP